MYHSKKHKKITFSKTIDQLKKFKELIMKVAVRFNYLHKLSPTINNNNSSNNNNSNIGYNDVNNSDKERA